jgi:hypothetical protein
VYVIKIGVTRGTGIRVGRREGQNQPSQTSSLVPDRCRNFANEILERIDDREDYGEIRFIALGRVDADVYRGRVHLAKRKPDPHHQRPESEQR